MQTAMRRRGILLACPAWLHRGGNAAVEFALVAPILVVLLNGAMIGSERSLVQSRLERFTMVVATMRTSPHGNDIETKVDETNTGRIRKMASLILGISDSEIDNLSFRVSHEFEVPQEGASAGLRPTYRWNTDGCDLTRPLPILRNGQPKTTEMDIRADEVVAFMAIDPGTNNEAIVARACYDYDPPMGMGMMGDILTAMHIIRRPIENSSITTSPDP